TAVAGFAQAGAREHDLVAAVPAFVARLAHRADDIDSGNERRGAGDAAIAAQGEPVFVVEARVGDLEQHLALAQLRLGEVDDVDARAVVAAGHLHCAHHVSSLCARGSLGAVASRRASLRDALLSHLDTSPSSPSLRLHSAAGRAESRSVARNGSGAVISTPPE